MDSSLSSRDVCVCIVLFLIAVSGFQGFLMTPDGNELFKVSCTSGYFAVEQGLAIRVSNDSILLLLTREAQEKTPLVEHK